MKEQMLNNSNNTKKFTINTTSIRFRVFSLHSVILFILFIFFLLCSTYLSKMTAKNTLNNYGKIILENFSNNFNSKAYAKFLDNPSVEIPEYSEVLSSLNDLRKTVNAQAVYILRTGFNGEKYVMLDSSNNPLPPGYVLKDTVKKKINKKARSLGQSKIEKGVKTEYINNSRGEFYSFRTPITHNNQQLGTLILNLDAGSLNKIITENKDKINSFVFKFSGVLFLFSLFMTALSISRLFHPIRSMQDFLTAISDGDLTKELTYAKHANEFSSIQNLLINVINGIKKILKSIISTSKDINNTFLAVEERKTNMVNKITEISDLTSNISKSNEKIFLNTNNVKDEIFSFNSAINKMYTEISQTKDISLKAQEKCIENTENIECFISGISPLIEKFERFRKNTTILSDLSIEIKQILKEINEIANQTKLLSLNASIVASSSEEHGENFSVVSTEIGELSHKTSQSVSLIQDALATIIKIIVNINSETVITSEIFREHAKKSEGFSNDLIKINSLISSTSSSLENIALKSKDLTEKNDLILELIEYINDESRSNNTILKAISDSTNKLHQTTSIFKVEFKKIGTYLRNIRKSYSVFKTNSDEV